MNSYAAYSDEQLTALLRDGHPEAFAEIYNRYKGILFVHAFKRLHDRFQAEDVLHDLFATLWATRSALHIHSGNLSGYLYTAVRNRVLNIYARSSTADSYLTSIAGAMEKEVASTD
nr:RNA polymerase subunit sigma-70 [Chitinophagaceae bacterium]